MKGKKTVPGKKTIGKSASSPSKKKPASCFKSFLEFLLFGAWLICTGIGGYFVGHTPVVQDCDPQTEPEVIVKKQDCVYAASSGSGVAAGAVAKPGGYSMEELTRLWKCSHAESNFSQANQNIFPKEKNLDKTKWKSILSVDPKAFFDKYLTQYPGDTRSVQPVVVFSHKPLKNFEELSDVCKVLDVAIVPDTPGVCVAVTETFHDVASYHMLHADKQSDGSFALTSNSIEGRVLPDESQYAAARGLLLEYFDHVEYVAKAVKICPKFGQGRVVVGTLVEDEDELALYKNALASAYKQGVNKGKFCAFSTNRKIADEIKKMGVAIALLNGIEETGRRGPAAVDAQMRRGFLQAWLAFAVANANIKMMWAGPGTVWFDRPDNIVKDAPVVETLWAFTGRKDKRAAPFFVSFDFFVPTGHERPVHLMHEVMLHFDLVLSWKSLDAVVSYRLSENNARYGTTTYIIPPYRVLHVDLMDSDVNKLRSAILSDDKPKAVVFPISKLPDSSYTAAKIKELQKSTGMWFSDE